MVLDCEIHSTIQEFGDLERSCYETKYNPVINDSNEIIGATAYSSNITERRHVEEELKESELKYRSLIECSSDAIFCVDENGQYQFTNHLFASTFGKTPDFFIGKTFWDIYPKEHADYRYEVTKRVFQTGESETIEVEVPLSDKTLFFLATANPIKDETGDVILNLTHAADITELKLAHEKVREKDGQFRKLSSQVPDLIYQFTRRPDGSYYVPVASEGIRNIFGCSPEDVLDDFTPIGNVLYPEDAARVISDIEYSAEHLTYFTCEFRVQIPGRDIQWIFSRSTPEKLADGSITWYGFNANITERKQAEEELIKAKNHAEKSDRLKSAFLANMSHEIRTPMNGILGFADLLKDQGLTGKQKREYIKVIQKSGDRMLNIINNIVDISRIEAGLMEVFAKESAINEQVNYLYTFFKPEVENKGLSLTVIKTLPYNDSLIKTDPEKLYAILTNLLKNAIKCTHVGSIEFGYVKKDTFLEFFISDTGEGIRPENIQLIFDRFRQGGDVDGKYNDGAGLGLSISKAFVEMLGGKIWVESEFGVGTTFYFTIPYLTMPKIKNAIINDATIESKQVQIKNLKILVAEDDENSDFLISNALRGYSNVLLHAKTGVEALDICRDNPDLDFILMDIRMPKMNGYEATRQIRTFNEKVIIIAQTAYGLSGERDRAIEAGCNDYIPKPINKSDFLKIIEKHLNELN